MARYRAEEHQQEHGKDRGRAAGRVRRWRMFSAIMNYHLNSRTATASRGALTAGGCEARNQMKIRSRFFIVKYYNSRSRRAAGGRRDTKSRLHLSVAAMALITLIIFIFFILSHRERGIFPDSKLPCGWVELDFSFVYSLIHF